jgi:hypothetical protein
LKLGGGFYSITPAVAIVHVQGPFFKRTDIEVLESLEDYLIFKVIQNKMSGIIDLEATIDITET